MAFTWGPFLEIFSDVHHLNTFENFTSEITATFTSELTHYGLMTPYGDMDLCQHWFRQWLVAWLHQAITWPNVDLSSVRSSDIHQSAISQETPQPLIIKVKLKINHLKSHSNLPGANELMLPGSHYRTTLLMPCPILKSLQLIWRSSTHRYNLQALKLQMSWGDLTWR